MSMNLSRALAEAEKHSGVKLSAKERRVIELVFYSVHESSGALELAKCYIDSIIKQRGLDDETEQV